MLRKKERAMTIAIVGIDLGKNSCSVAGLDATGAVVLRRRVSRGKLVEFLERAAALRGGDGGLLRRAPPRPRRVRGARATRCG